MINYFGDLSNSELLRRYGFVEAEPNPHDCAEIALADVLQKTGHGAALQAACCNADSRSAQGHSSSTGHSLHAGNISSSAAAARLAFLQRSGLVPPDGWFKVSMQGVPSMELVEAVRLCLLPGSCFHAFTKEVAAWRVPRVRPLSRKLTADVPAGLGAVLRELCNDRLLGLTDADKIPTSQTADDVTIGTMVATVRHSEVVALRRLMQWVNQSDSEVLMKLCTDFWRHPRMQPRHECAL